MSQDPNSFDNFDYGPFLIDHCMDDTEEQMMAMLLEQWQRSSSRAQAIPRQPRRYIERGRESGQSRLYEDYFDQHNPVYPPDKFRRFRIRRELFIRIVDAVTNHDSYFEQRPNGHRRLGLSPLQKCTSAICQLAYGAPADSYDEYLRMAETTSIQALFKFCCALIEVFGPIYLRRRNANDVQRLLQKHSQKHGFPSMLGSLDCMHWDWRNYPVAWKGQFTRGDHGVPTIILEAVASYDLWIWHAFFGVAGSNNDINVLNQSPLFNDVLQVNSPDVQFMVNQATYRKGYYLADGIYPEWATIVKCFKYPEDPKRKKFTQKQESARKDVERAIGVLQSRWAIIRGLGRFWYRNNLSDIMYACIILHYMIIEDEGDEAVNWEDEEGNPPPPPNQGVPQGVEVNFQRHSELRDRFTHHKLQADLVEHIWVHFGNDADSE